MQRSELTAWLRLLLTPGVGRRTARCLLAACGLPEHVFSQPALWPDMARSAPLQALAHEPPTLAAQVEATWRWLHTQDGGIAHTIVTLGDAAYPPCLLATQDPPLLLYVQGPAQQLARPAFFPEGRCLAMVGSRNPTAQGTQNAHALAQALAEAGWCIVSGMALGVDAAAHEGALQASRSSPGTVATIAVVGTGLDRVYPSSHQALAQRIAQNGLLVSEYPLGTPPKGAHFPQRNRIISGLAQGTLVVEAALQSGSLITARLAAEQGREVFAIPGSIHAPQSRGCHALLRQGAKLVETAQDVLEELQPSATPPKISATPTADYARVPEDGHEDALLTAMGWDPVGLDALQARTGLATAALQVALLEHELAGAVARLPGGRFQRQAVG